MSIPYISAAKILYVSYAIGVFVLLALFAHIAVALFWFACCLQIHLSHKNPENQPYYLAILGVFALVALGAMR